MEPTSDNHTRELDHRTSDGLDVALLWESHSGRVFVAVTDQRTSDRFRIEVKASNALDAFRHPYAYDNRSGRASSGRFAETV